MTFKVNLYKLFDMKPRIYIISAISVFLLSIAGIAFAWGVWGHEHINRGAIFALPVEMRMFFYNHADFITQESTVPDLRKYTMGDKTEGPRHYIDLEDYGLLNLDSVPLTMKDAKERFSEKDMQSNGILPWHIQEMMEKLTKAFRDGRRNEILFLAGDLGHYIGDAHMPLHTSSNHDGQLTNQKGIHSFWESQLPEYFGDGYTLKVNDPVYLKDVTSASWDIIRHTHSLVDSLLKMERVEMAAYSGKDLYRRDNKGEIAKNIFGRNVYSDEFAASYHNALQGMVNDQMRRAVQTLANFWYTAWVNAGKPDLSGLDSPEVTASNRKKYEAEYSNYKKGKVNGFKAEKEYRGY